MNGHTSKKIRNIISPDADFIDVGQETKRLYRRVKKAYARIPWCDKQAFLQAVNFQVNPSEEK